MLIAVIASVMGASMQPRETHASPPVSSAAIRDREPIAAVLDGDENISITSQNFFLSNTDELRFALQFSGPAAAKLRSDNPGVTQRSTLVLSTFPAISTPALVDTEPSGAPLGQLSIKLASNNIEVSDDQGDDATSDQAARDERVTVTVTIGRRSTGAPLDGSIERLALGSPGLYPIRVTLINDEQRLASTLTHVFRTGNAKSADDNDADSTPVRAAFLVGVNDLGPAPPKAKIDAARTQVRRLVNVAEKTEVPLTVLIPPSVIDRVLTNDPQLTNQLNRALTDHTLLATPAWVIRPDVAAAAGLESRFVGSWSAGREALTTAFPKIPIEASTTLIDEPFGPSGVELLPRAGISFAAFRPLHYAQSEPVSAAEVNTHVRPPLGQLVSLASADDPATPSTPAVRAMVTTIVPRPEAGQAVQQQAAPSKDEGTTATSGNDKSNGEQGNSEKANEEQSNSTQGNGDQGDKPADSKPADSKPADSKPADREQTTRGDTAADPPARTNRLTPAEQAILALARANAAPASNNPRTNSVLFTLSNHSVPSVALLDAFAKMGVGRGDPSTPDTPSAPLIEWLPIGTLLSDAGNFELDGAPVAVRWPIVAENTIEERLPLVDAAEFEIRDTVSMLPSDDQRRKLWINRIESARSTDISNERAIEFVNQLVKNSRTIRNAVPRPEPFEFTLTGSNATLRVQLTNTSATPLNVGFLLDSDRLIGPERTDVRLAPNAVTDVPIQVRSRTNGRVTAQIQAVTPAGGALFEPVTLTGSSNSFGGLGTALSVGALLVLLSWWFSHFMRRQRETSPEATTNSSTTNSSTADSSTSEEG